MGLQPTAAVATVPVTVAATVTQPEVEANPPGGSGAIF